MSNFNMKGKEMCGLGKEGFLARVPPFMGDILWEHLDMMLKGEQSLSFPHHYHSTVSFPPPLW